MLRHRRLLFKNRDCETAWGKSGSCRKAIGNARGLAGSALMDTHSVNDRAQGDQTSRFGNRPGVEGLGTTARAEARGSGWEVFEARGTIVGCDEARRTNVRSAVEEIVACSSPRRREDLIAEVIDGDLLLFDPVTANTHHLNETAHAIWRMCDGTRTVADIADALCGPFDVERDAALRSAGDLLQKLAAQGLLAEDGTPRGG